jgi:hypothetical protein
MQIAIRLFSCTPGDDIPLPGTKRMVFTLEEYLRTTPPRFIHATDMIAFQKVARSLGAAYRNDHPTPDGIPLMYVVEYDVFLQSVWLSNTIPRALAVASHNHMKSLCGMIDPDAPEFVSKMFLSILDAVVDARLLLHSAYHPIFMSLPRPDADAYHRTYGRMPTKVVYYHQTWRKAEVERNDVEGVFKWCCTGGVALVDATVISM